MNLDERISKKVMLRELEYLQEINGLLKTIFEKNKEILRLNKQIEDLENDIAHYKDNQE